jgi:hypothetical protein
MVPPARSEGTLLSGFDFHRSLPAEAENSEINRRNGPVPGLQFS